METTLDNYLDQIQKEDEQLQEVDPITAAGIAVGAGTLMVLWNLIRMLAGLKAFKKALKVNKPLSKELNRILGTGNKWVVQVVPDKTPNAFAAGGVHVFITSGLLKILNKREQMAVLLHEVYHNEKKHLAKRVGYEYSLYYLLIYIIALLTPGPQLLFLAALAFQISLAILRIPYAILVGRKHEYGADAYTVKDYRNRLKQLAIERKEAEESDDILALEEVNRETEQVENILAGKYNKKGQIVTMHPRVKKNIDKVKKAITRFLEKINNSDYQELYNHLNNSLKIGTYCSYSPDKHIPWITY